MTILTFFVRAVKKLFGVKIPKIRNEILRSKIL